MNNYLKEYTESFFLTPAECNAEQQMPITVLVSRIIEVATLHANIWGIGYDALAKDGESWVLSRITLEMERYPQLSEHYSLITWVESFNKFFSERNFEIKDGNGTIIGYARTIWVVINSTTRASADLSKFTFLQECISDKECPIAKQNKLRALSDCTEIAYTFKYCDVDFNRHVNSCKYIELLLNHWALDFHDSHKLARFEIAYMKEAYYGEDVKVRFNDKTLDCQAELLHNGTALCRAHFIFEEIPNK